jgi:hypothetical protein
MKKRTKIVMLPTEQRTPYQIGQRFICKPEYEGGLNTGIVERLTSAGHPWAGNGIIQGVGKPQHLYFTSDEEPKDGEWVIETSNKNLISQFSEQSLNQRSMGCRKIIATTDILKIKEVDSFEFGSPQDEYYVPQIPQSFIEEYCRKGGIDEVDVEYEEEGRFAYTGDTRYIPKVDTVHNTITIHPIKDSWNREEVEKLCKEAFSCGVRLWEDWEEEDVEMWEKFKKENL